MRGDFSFTKRIIWYIPTLKDDLASKGIQTIRRRVRPRPDNKNYSKRANRPAIFFLQILGYNMNERERFFDFAQND